MASMLTRSVFVLLLLLFFCCLVQGAPRIVAPFPDNLYAIENEKTNVTCVVEDTVSNPEEIVFVRKTQFGDINPIRDEGPSGRIYYQNETLGDGSKKRVTLHFNEVKVEDDSKYGGYECQGHSGGSQHEYGFTVTVIELSEFPEVHPSANITAKFGEQIQVSCNVTTSTSGSRTTVSKFSWTKDGTEVLLASSCPSLSSIVPLVFNVSTGNVGGTYTCYLEYLLRNVVKKIISKTIIVKVQPKFFPVKKEEKKVKRLVCSAQGYPLVTEWKRKKLHDDSIFVFDTKDTSSHGKYVFSNLDKPKDHTLTIYDVQTSDAGQYYCCIKNSTSPRAPSDFGSCQLFDVLPAPSCSSSDSSVGKASLIRLPIILLGFMLIWSLHV